MCQRAECRTGFAIVPICRKLAHRDQYPRRDQRGTDLRIEIVGIHAGALHACDHSEIAFKFVEQRTTEIERAVLLDVLATEVPTLDRRRLLRLRRFDVQHRTLRAGPLRLRRCRHQFRRKDWLDKHITLAPWPAMLARWRLRRR